MMNMNLTATVNQTKTSKKTTVINFSELKKEVIEMAQSHDINTMINAKQQVTYLYENELIDIHQYAELGMLFSHANRAIWNQRKDDYFYGHYSHLVK